jgi:hypothetical protein
MARAGVLGPKIKFDTKKAWNEHDIVRTFGNEITCASRLAEMEKVTAHMLRVERRPRLVG